MKPQKTERLELRLTPKQKKRLERQAAKLEQTLSAYVLRAVIDKIEKDEAR